MLGLALSMGASGFLFPRPEGRAVAAEPPAAASEAAATPVGTSADLLRPQAVGGQQTSEIRRSAPWASGVQSRSGVQFSNSDAAKEAIASPEGMNAAPASGLRADRDRSLSRLRQHRSQLRQALSPDGSIPALRVQEPNQALPKPALEPGSATIVYHVRPGDTLASIAQAHGIEQEELIAWNRLSDPHFLRVHQALIVPAPVGGESELALTESSTPLTTAPASAQPQVAAADLEQLSTLQEPVVAQPVTEPVAVEANVAPIDTDASSEAVAAETDDRTPPAMRSVVHRISPGETLGAIVRNYGIPKETLVSENAIRNPNLIIAGQELQIPVSLETMQAEPLTLAARMEQATTLQPDGQEVSGKSVPGEMAEADVMPPTVPTAIRSLPQENLVSAAVLPVELSQPEVTVVQPQIVEDTDLSGSDFSSQLAKANPHASVLMTQIAELQESRGTARAEVFSSAQQPILMAAADTSDIQLFDAASEPATEAEALLSPEEMEQRASELKVRSDSEEVVRAVEEPQVVAAAPVGSESYAPLLEPIIGRMVSPELPPLAAADAFLPEGTNIFDGYIWPAQGVLTSGYGPRWGRMHRGIDIAAPVGTPIHSAAAGVVEFSGWNSGGYGYMVDIRHPDGSMTRYAHNSRLLVRAGQEVDQGDQIAEMGSTGRSTGPHVHFEIHLPSQGAVNPAPLLARR